MLSPSQKEQFEHDGYCVAVNAVTTTEIATLNDELNVWVEKSRQHRAAFGETSDKRPRFDVEDGHTGKTPRLRRINNPAEISDNYYHVTFGDALVDRVSTLIGPNIKFLHSKINLKLGNTDTRVGYHQDFSYVPHTNPDVVTALLMLDDMTHDNGALLVVPASHRGAQATLWEDDIFTGEVTEAKSAECQRQAVTITGKAGDVCLMHAQLLHGSQPNRSQYARGLYICMYSAADAFLLCQNSLPNRFEGYVIRGEPSRVARLHGGLVELPEDSHRASFFQLQSEAAGKN